MKNINCIAFLQDILPRLSLRWAGYRKVHGQVCKRITRRIRELHLANFLGYRSFLEENPSEWFFLKEFCRITISRFYRDRQVFMALEKQVLPQLAETAPKPGNKPLRCWSVGCASGEEPYTLALVWGIWLKPSHPEADIDILATDADAAVLKRAELADYPWSSVRELPEDLLKEGFSPSAGNYRLRPAFRDMVTFKNLDILDNFPEGPFHLLLCRNLVFTYFAESLQKDIFEKLEKCLLPGGFLVIGAHERLPYETGFGEVERCIYQKRA